MDDHDQDWDERYILGLFGITVPPAAYHRRVTDEVTCPKGCDTATPPARVDGDIFVCDCCGTAFLWRGST